MKILQKALPLTPGQEICPSSKRPDHVSRVQRGGEALYPEVKRPGRDAATHVHLVPELWMSGSIPQLAVNYFTACGRISLFLPFISSQKLLIFRCVRQVAKNAYYICHVCLSVCTCVLSACISRATTSRISLKFDVEGSYDNTWRKFQLG